MKTDLALPIDQITKFCQHWQIIELSLFGSILRDDFHADSDIDIRRCFCPHSQRASTRSRPNAARSRSSAK
ncbi:nucleotidyltransferase domain-containing protein [Microcoleus sp. F6_B5]